MNPTVTVLVDTYNHERFIEEALVSVVEQDFPTSDMEILVVDDGSTDRTPEIVRAFAPRVRLLRKTNGGQASAFNFGIPQARGEIVAFLDGDDWWARNKLTRIAETMAADPEVGMVGHGYFEMASQTSTLRRVVPSETSCFSLRTDGGAQAFRNYMAFLGTSRVSIRNSVLQRVLPIAEPLIIEADEFMSAAAAAVSSALIIPEPLTFYRLHDSNLFQLQSGDPVRLRRKQQILAVLADLLSRRLHNMGVAPQSVSTVVDPIRVSSDRLRLYLDGGRRIDAFRAEKADMRHSYERLSAGYYAWKQLSLGLALILPPRRYYRLRERYATSGLRQFRSWLGEPQPRARINATEASPETFEKENRMADISSPALKRTPRFPCEIRVANPLARPHEAFSLRILLRDAVVESFALLPLRLKLWLYANCKRLLLGMLFRLEKRRIVVVRAGPSRYRHPMYLSWQADTGWVLGIYEPHLLQTLKQHLKQGDCCMDIGANLGYFTSVMSHLVGDDGEVIAFEPLPNNVKVLEQNIALEGLENVKIEPKAVSDSVGTACLVIQGDIDFTGTASLTEVYDWGGERAEVPVPVITLDSYVAELSKRPSLLKIDVEGAELQALRGAKNVLSTARPILLIEIHGWGSPQSGELVDLLEERGYEIKILGRRNREAFCLAISLLGSSMDDAQWS